MRLVKVASNLVRDEYEDIYELQASEGEPALPNPLPLPRILDSPEFREARARIAADHVYVEAVGGVDVLRLRALQVLNPFQHAVGHGVEIGTV